MNEIVIIVALVAFSYGLGMLTTAIIAGTVNMLRARREARNGREDGVDALPLPKKGKNRTMWD